MSQPDPIADLKKNAQDIADAMTKVADSIAKLNLEGDADEQMRIITEENNRVLERIRQLYNLPAPPAK